VYNTTFQQDDPSWTIVFQFYAAVHLTQSYLVSKNLPRFDAKNHQGRWEAIKGCSELPQRFRSNYRDLKDLSENVRYDPSFVPTSQNFTDALGQLGVVESFLKSKVERALAGK
jgi:hypothetical protein